MKKCRFKLVFFRNTSLDCNLEPLSHVNLRITRGFAFKSYQVNYNEKSTNMITFNRVISFSAILENVSMPVKRHDALVASVAPDDKQTLF